MTNRHGHPHLVLYKFTKIGLWGARFGYATYGEKGHSDWNTTTQLLPVRFRESDFAFHHTINKEGIRTC